MADLVKMISRLDRVSSTVNSPQKSERGTRLHATSPPETYRQTRCQEQVRGAGRCQYDPLEESPRGSHSWRCIWPVCSRVLLSGRPNSRRTRNKSRSSSANFWSSPRRTAGLTLPEVAQELRLVLEWRLPARISAGRALVPRNRTLTWNDARSNPLSKSNQGWLLCPTKLGTVEEAEPEDVRLVE